MRQAATVDGETRFDDEYDRRAFEHVLIAMREGPSPMDRAAGRVNEAIGFVGRKVSKRLPATLTDGTTQALRAALAGLQTLTMDPALRSVRTDRVMKGFARQGDTVVTLEEIRKLPLRKIDSVIPGLGWRYAAAAATEGAGAGLVITGGELLATAGSAAGAGAGAAPGAGTVAGAIAFDAATVLAASARVIAHLGAYHGYDTRLPDEQVFALAIIDWSSAGTESAKLAAFQHLSRITQQIIRGATWVELSDFLMVKIVQEIYERLGIRLTKYKLGQAIPVAGIVIGAGMNAALIRSVAEHARVAYRARHLSEKYGLDFSQPRGAQVLTTDSGSDVIDIPEIVERIERHERPPGNST